jgi:hypothetical protein
LLRLEHLLQLENNLIAVVEKELLMKHNRFFVLWQQQHLRLFSGIGNGVSSHSFNALFFSTDHRDDVIAQTRVGLGLGLDARHKTFENYP